MKLIFIGPQGSGKGTQAKRVADRFGLCHISSGDLLRGVRGNLKSEVDSFMSKGELVPDELIVKILKEKLDEGNCDKGFILDGFPRTVNQAEELKKITEIDKVVEIFISDEEASRRICARRTCIKCGAIFNTNSLRPKIEGICDKCGGRLITREDDSEEALRERLKVYHKETEKVLEMYDVIRIDGEQDIEKVFEDIIEGID